MPNIIVRDYVTTMKRLHNKYDERLSSLMFMNDYSINEQNVIIIYFRYIMTVIYMRLCFTVTRYEILVSSCLQYIIMHRT